MRLKLLVSLAVMALLAVLVDVPAALGQLAAITPGHALAASALFLLTHAANAAKLGVLVPERPYRALLAYTLLAQAYALLLPGQIAGEAVKAYRLARDGGAGTGHAAASAVIFDKLTALVGVLLLTLAGMAASSGRFGAALGWAAAAGLGGLAAAAALLTSDRVRRLAEGLAGRPHADTTGQGERAGHIGAAAARFLEAWAAMAQRPRVVVASLAWGVAAQLLAVAGSQALGLGLGIDLPFATWCVVIGGLTVALLAPVTVAGIGVREGSLAGLLGLLGVPAEQAVALGLAILAFQLLVGLAGLAVDVILLKGHEKQS